MLTDQEDVYYYLTLMNENVRQPAMPKGAEQGILKGMYRLPGLDPAGARKGAPRVQLLGSGMILQEVLHAAALLRQDFGVEADLWSCPSFTLLARDGQAAERASRLHPGAAPRRSWVEECLAGASGPVVAATDYVRAFAEQIRPWVGRRYVVLGTDGFGRSDTRARLRRFFEVDRHHVAVAALKALADEGAVPAPTVAGAIEKYGIDGSRPDPWTV
jgi:pyruvate dehydrogenase E1 component